MEIINGTTGIEAAEIGILVFNVAQYRLGINLFKVRELTPMPQIKLVPYSHHAIQGVFELRNHLVPVINLRAWLGVDSQYTQKPKIIVTEFLGLKVGFLVDSVERIHRLYWSDIEPPGRFKQYSREIVGIIKSDDRIISMIDYENIVLSINPDIILQDTKDSEDRKDSKKLVEKRKTKSVWIVDDSNTIRDFLKNHLMEKGYTNLVFFENGKHALETLSILKRKKQTKRDENERVDIIITDIEMPVMNGYSLIKELKKDEVLKTIPVILFSSFISAENKLRGEIVEADAQLSKSESINLVHLIDRFIFR